MLMHVSISLLPTPTMQSQGIKPLTYGRMVLLEDVPNAIEAAIRKIVTDEDQRAVLTNAGCLNVIIQRFTRPAGAG